MAVRFVDASEIVEIPSLTESNGLIRIIEEDGWLSYEVDEAVGGPQLCCDLASMLLGCSHNP